MKKVIITTTINQPTEAIEKFDSMADWELVVSGDLKTPSNYALKNGKYISPSEQELFDKTLSNLIGWNCIQRRNFATLFALKELKADIIAAIDDDNIPLPGWGEHLMLGKHNVSTFETEQVVFEPLNVTNHPELWHRGYPVQLLHSRSSKYIGKHTYEFDIQADLWNGDPDVDAICRIAMSPNVTFDVCNHYTSTAKFSPFNSQNTFLTRRVAKHFMVLPDVQRMDDIWAAYYVESLGFKPVYAPASVVQIRNEHNLVKDLENEMIGYKNTIKLLNQEPFTLQSFISERSWLALKRFEYITNNLD
jgi:hypothetical protein